MQTRAAQMNLATLLLLVACAAMNLWCFRTHVLLGLVSLNISKHILIAGLCRAIGVNRSAESDGTDLAEGHSSDGLAV